MYEMSSMPPAAKRALIIRELLPAADSLSEGYRLQFPEVVFDYRDFVDVTDDRDSHVYKVRS